MKLGVGGASSFSSQIACVCQQQWGELCFGSGNDHAELTGVTLAVKLPSKPGSPPFLQSLQTTKWFYLKSKIIKQAPLLLKSAGIFYFLQPRVFTDNTQVSVVTPNL